MRFPGDQLNQVPLVSSGERMLDENEKLFLGAILHIRSLERKVQRLRQEVQRQENEAAAAAAAVGAAAADAAEANRLPAEDTSPTVIGTCPSRGDSSSGILDFEGRSIDTNVYKLNIVCTKGNVAFLKLVQAIERQNATIVRAHFSSWNNEMHGTYIVQAPAWEDLSMDDVRNLVTESLTSLNVEGMRQRA